MLDSSAIQAKNAAEFAKLPAALRSPARSLARHNVASLWVLLKRGDAKSIADLKDALPFLVEDNIDIEGGISLIAELISAKISSRDKVELLEKVPEIVLRKLVRQDLRNAKENETLVDEASSQPEIALLLLKKALAPKDNSAEALRKHFIDSADANLGTLLKAKVPNAAANSGWGQDAIKEMQRDVLQRLSLLSIDPAKKLTREVDAAQREKIVKTLLSLKADPAFFIDPVFGPKALDNGGGVALRAVVNYAARNEKVTALDLEKLTATIVGKDAGFFDAAKEVARANRKEERNYLEEKITELQAKPEYAAHNELAKKIAESIRREKGGYGLFDFFTIIGKEGHAQMAAAQREMFAKLMDKFPSADDLPKNKEEIKNIVDQFKAGFDVTSGRSFIFPTRSFTINSSFKAEFPGDAAKRRGKKSEESQLVKKSAAELVTQKTIDNWPNDQKFVTTAEAIMEATLTAALKGKSGSVGDAMKTAETKQAISVLAFALIDRFGISGKLIEKFPALFKQPGFFESEKSNLVKSREVQEFVGEFSTYLKFDGNKFLGIDVDKFLRVDAALIDEKLNKAAMNKPLVQAAPVKQEVKRDYSKYYEILAKDIVKYAVREDQEDGQKGDLKPNEALRIAEAAVLEKLRAEYPNPEEMAADFKIGNDKEYKTKVRTSAQQISAKLGLDFEVESGNLAKAAGAFAGIFGKATSVGTTIKITSANPNLAAVSIKPGVVFAAAASSFVAREEDFKSDDIAFSNDSFSPEIPVVETQIETPNNNPFAEESPAAVDAEISGNPFADDFEVPAAPKVPQESSNPFDDFEAPAAQSSNIVAPTISQNPFDDEPVLPSSNPFDVSSQIPASSANAQNPSNPFEQPAVVSQSQNPFDSDVSKVAVVPTNPFAEEAAAEVGRGNPFLSPQPAAEKQPIFLPEEIKQDFQAVAKAVAKSAIRKKQEDLNPKQEAKGKIEESEAVKRLEELALQKLVQKFSGNKALLKSELKIDSVDASHLSKTESVKNEAQELLQTVSFNVAIGANGKVQVSNTQTVKQESSLKIGNISQADNKYVNEVADAIVKAIKRGVDEGKPAGSKDVRKIDDEAKMIKAVAAKLIHESRGNISDLEKQIPFSKHGLYKDAAIGILAVKILPCLKSEKGKLAIDLKALDSREVKINHADKVIIAEEREASASASRQ